MGFVRWMATTGKVEISKEVQNEVETIYLHSIVSIMENNKIPKSMLINQDQTPSKYVPGCNKTLASKGIKCLSCWINRSKNNYSNVQYNDGR